MKPHKFILLRDDKGNSAVRYMGSKVRVWKDIVPLITADRKKGQLYFEPFVGGGNVICHVTGAPRLGTDSNPYVIALLNALASGWKPPEHVPEDVYRDVREHQENFAPELVGFCGTQVSFGAAWFGGYARGKGAGGRPRDFSNEGYRACVAQSAGLKGAQFVHSDYGFIRFGKPSIIYCDPPYAGVTGYRGTKTEFDSAAFWKWCAARSDEGHRVFVSEYAAPEGWREIWSREVEGFRSQTPTGCKVKRPTEKLFVRDS